MTTPYDRPDSDFPLYVRAIAILLLTVALATYFWVLALVVFFLGAVI